MEMTTTSSSQLSTFSQQGTVDWTALSQTSYNATIAVLGRLSAAGLEPLTVAMAQAICIQIPIGTHGEQQLQQAMCSLKAFSTLSELVWFGTGVRHILRTLVQTSQGASSVALAAALVEGHSKQFTAHVFYELVKMSGGPSELTPAYGQWITYVEVCSGIFATSNLSCTTQQLLRLTGLSVPFDQPLRPVDCVGEPRQLAAVLLAVGRVQQQHWESIDVHGAAECCWLAAVCDLIFGLRVQLRDTNASVVFQNYNGEHQTAQIKLHVVKASANSLVPLGRTFTIQPLEFLERWRAQGNPNDFHHLNGSLHRGSMMNELFGMLPAPVVKLVPELIAACAGIYCTNSRLSTWSTPEAYLGRMEQNVPELSANIASAQSILRGLCLTAETRSAKRAQDFARQSAPYVVQTTLNANGTENLPNFVKAYKEDELATLSLQLLLDTKRSILQNCKCGHHPWRCTTFTVCLCPMLLAYMLDCVVYDDAISKISQHGLRHLFEECFTRRLFGSDENNLATADRVRAHLMLSSMPTVSTHDLPRTFLDHSRLLLHLFSGHEPPDDIPVALQAKVSGISHAGLYAYVSHLRHPFQSYEEASQIHVGRGAIHGSGRSYNMIMDNDVEFPLGSDEGVTRRRNRMSKYAGDYGYRAIVEVNVRLRFWYERWALKDSHTRHAVNPMACLSVGLDGPLGA